jgi:hypothetical protein
MDGRPHGFARTRHDRLPIALPITERLDRENARLPARVPACNLPRINPPAQTRPRPDNTRDRANARSVRRKPADARLTGEPTHPAPCPAQSPH